MRGNAMTTWAALFTMGALGALGCGGAATPPPSTPSPSSSISPASTGPSADGGPRAPVDPFVLPAGPRDELTKPGPVPVRLDAWEAAIKAKGVAAPPAACAAFARRAPASPPPADVVAALGAADAAKVDAALVALEPKLDVKEAGLVRALRADLAPSTCADVIVDPYLASHRALVSRASHVLVGLSLAAKLERTGAGKPQLGADVVAKEKVKAFIGGPLKTWMVEQSTAIETLSSGAAGLTGYGRGIAALAAGIADLRLVDVIRTAPTPPSWDPELKAVYQAALDEALEPRKRRGRDAALVGLSDLAQTGAIADARTRTAHQLLSSLYGGRRVSALGELLVARATDEAATTPLQKATVAVAPFWIDTFDLAVTGEADIAVELTHGVPVSAREPFAASSTPPTGKVRSAFARARLRMGQLYWRRVDFVEAAYAAKSGTNPDDRLLLALAIALAQGPNGAADMMRAPSAAQLELRHTEALDALVAEGGPLAGLAAFDAAHLRSLAPPEGSEAAPYFRDVAARFRKAESLLVDAEQKKLALRRAEEADAILASVDAKR